MYNSYAEALLLHHAPDSYYKTETYSKFPPVSWVIDPTDIVQQRLSFSWILYLKKIVIPEF